MASMITLLGRAHIPEFPSSFGRVHAVLSEGGKTGQGQLDHTKTDSPSARDMYCLVWLELLGWQVPKWNHDFGLVWQILGACAANWR
ncbi:hypothetical protein IF2G_06696 [Cordyceps javanica]|nr:hypothetical protein IF2G_06696 [Cordyceps javanica]